MPSRHPRLLGRRESASESESESESERERRSVSADYQAWPCSSIQRLASRALTSRARRSKLAM
jgi:hypothetical protein